MDNLPIDVNMIVSRQYWNPLCRRNTRSVGIDFLNLSDEQRAEYNEMKIEFSTKINYKTFVMLYKSIKKITDYVIYESIKVYPDDESKPSDQSNELRYNLERQCKMLATKWEPVRLSYSDYVDSD
uniref:Uncharacterized protein n=1 Tax=Rhabditophanes sp. KR3021 TaxID=114890 RepID=A0AC35TPX0_9BILA